MKSEYESKIEKLVERAKQQDPKADGEIVNKT